MKCFNDRFAFCSYFLTVFSFIFVFIFQVVSWIMTIWLFGSVMIFVLARVLGGDVNYSQCLGVIGYSVLPLFVVGLILPVTHSLPWLHFIIKVRRTKDRCQDFLTCSYYPTGRKISLDFKFHYYAKSKFAIFKSNLLFELCGFTNDSIYKRIYKTKTLE